MRSILLVHSPLVGPGTLEPLAAALRIHGHTVLCPDVRGASTWADFTDVAVTSCRNSGFAPDVLVAHSGAGAVIPAIGSTLGVGRLVFLDALLPPESGPWMPSDVMRSRLATMAAGSATLPPWHEWWNPNMLRRLVPDERQRLAIADECPAVPIALYDSAAPSIDAWSSPDSCVYIQLSNAYTDEAAEARERAWSVIAHDGQHLDTATRPDIIAGLVDTASRSTRVRVGDLASLRLRGGVTVPRNAPKLLVVAPSDAGPFAVANECAHQGAELLAGYVHQSNGTPWIECPLHMWRFELATGVRLIREERADDPADRIATFPCAVDRTGMIWVDPGPVLP